ncbi:MAG: heat-inducible transcriptional repressor HrcA [Gaiellaceae bacterium]|jgi:heat-inducible transcriptional repressor
MPDPLAISLSDRQRRILRLVVEEYVTNGQPVGSRHLVERAGLSFSSSTVRYELAELEERGLLTHPHTSAGRVPTDGGYRYYADSLLSERSPQSDRLPLDLRAAQNEVEQALEATTEMLAEMTHLLALASAPSLETTAVRHVEVLLLQPRVVLVVLITSAGEVSKRVCAFEAPVDPGFVSWAREYLNECLEGRTLGPRLLRQALEDPALTASERDFLAVLRPALEEQIDRGDERVFVGGAATLLDAVRGNELDACRSLLSVLERRAATLELLRASIEQRRPFVRVGEELDNPALSGVSLVGARYGLVQRSLGTVSLLGPIRMDYEKAIGAVRAAAQELSRFVEEVYEES